MLTWYETLSIVFRVDRTPVSFSKAESIASIPAISAAPVVPGTLDAPYPSLSCPESLRPRKSLGMGVAFGVGGAVGSGVAAAVGVGLGPAALQAAISAGRAVSPAAPASPALIRSRLEIGSFSPRSPIALSGFIAVRRFMVNNTRAAPQLWGSPGSISGPATSGDSRAARVPWPDDQTRSVTVGCGAISVPLAPVP